MATKTSDKPVVRLKTLGQNQLGSLTTVAYQAIKNQILGNQLQPGEALPIERLIRELGLSRTPIREAILRLEKEGLVTIMPRMGTFVSHLNIKEIQEMYQVRRELEGLAARLAAEQINPEQLAAVEQELMQCSLTGEINYKAMSEAGQSLHRLIVDSCGNDVLANFIRSLQDHFTRFRSLSLNISEKILASHREHLKILKALKQGDSQLSERLIHEHFDHAGRLLLNSLLTHSNRREAQVTVKISR